MEALRLLRQAIDYVEEHLHENIEINDIARAAMSSKYHFQRMFHALTGFTVTEYVRNRRLTLAAEELVGTDSKVIDVALKYGYESPEAFSKAFQRMHGVTPLAAKKKNVKLKAFPRISFQIQIKGETEMNYRIVEEKALTVVGKDTIIKKDPYTEIPAFVEKIWKNGTHDRINEAIGRPAGTLLNGYHFDFSEDGTRRYLMGAELPEGIETTEELTILHIPAQTYVVFDNRGSFAGDAEIGLQIYDVWRRIYSEWFPSSSFEQVEGPCIERYYWVDDSHTESICELRFSAFLLCDKQNLSKRLHAKYTRPYLLRGLKIDRPNQVWGIDITYLRMGKGFMYLFNIIDWYSRKVIDYELSSTLEKSFVLKCLKRAFSRCKPEIINSDQGSHFTNADYLELLEKEGVKVSMDGKGRATDNSRTERYFRTLKYECIYQNEFEDPRALRKGIARYVQFYNQERPHQSLKEAKPDQFYAHNIEQIAS